MIPRAAVAADRVVEVLDTVERPAADTRSPGRRARHTGIPRRRVRLPGCRGRRCSDLSFGRRRPDDGDHRQHRSRQDDARQPRGAAVRRHRRQRCWSTAWMCASSTPTCSGAASATCHRSRTCSPARWRRTCATGARRHRRGTVAGARGRPGVGFVQAMPVGLESEINQGGTNVSGGQRQRWWIARALVEKPEIYDTMRPPQQKPVTATRLASPLLALPAQATVASRSAITCASGTFETTCATICL